MEIQDLLPGTHPIVPTRRIVHIRLIDQVVAVVTIHTPAIARVRMVADIVPVQAVHHLQPLILSQNQLRLLIL